VDKYAALVKAGKRFAPGGPYREFVPGFGVLLEQVSRALYREWFTRAFDFYPQGEFTAFQLLWPDRNGAWPWESRWQRHIVPQPVLTATGRPKSAGRLGG